MNPMMPRAHLILLLIVLVLVSRAEKQAPGGAELTYTDQLLHSLELRMISKRKFRSFILIERRSVFFLRLMENKTLGLYINSEW